MDNSVEFSLYDLCKYLSESPENKTDSDRRSSLLSNTGENHDSSSHLDMDEPVTKRRNSHSPQRRQTVEQQIILQEEIERRYTKFGSQYEVNERQNARLYIDKLHQVLPQLSEMYSIQDVDEALQTFSTRFCAGKKNHYINLLIFVQCNLSEVNLIKTNFCVHK